MINKPVKKAALLSVCSVIISCTSNYPVSTNLDKDNFSQYFSASKVKIYQDEKEIASAYKYLSVVEGQDCQQRPHHALPDKVNARTQARQQAFKLNANAVIFTGCAELDHEKLVQLNNSNDAKQCHAMVICYAKAFIVQSEVD
jgi:RcsF protein